MRVFVVLSGAALLLPGAALADPAATTTTAPMSRAQAQQNDRDKVVCHSEQIVGSHLSERVCRTKSDWESARTTDKRTLDRRNGQLTAPTRRGNGG